VTDRYDSLADRLAAIAEELRDLAYDRLAARAADPGATGAAALKAEERHLEQARRAVEKASLALHRAALAADPAAAGHGDPGDVSDPFA
jgi:hypothetical protein